VRQPCAAPRAEPRERAETRSRSARPATHTAGVLQAGLEGTMAGKAELVNAVVAPPASEIQDLPTLDGWKQDAAGVPDPAPAPGSSLLLDPLGG